MSKIDVRNSHKRYVEIDTKRHKKTQKGHKRGSKEKKTVETQMTPQRHIRDTKETQTKHIRDTWDKKKRKRLNKDAMCFDDSILKSVFVCTV